MPNPFAPGAAGVISADIAVPEHEREFRFYSRILTTGRAPLWRDDLTNVRGTPVIGLGARVPAYEALPLQWMPHVQVADVSTTVRFYEQVVGWSTAPADVLGTVQMQRLDGVSAAEIRHASGEDAGVPPVWILSLPVDDLEQSLRLVREGGGEVVSGSADHGHAVIRDPIGVWIALQANR